MTGPISAPGPEARRASSLVLLAILAVVTVLATACSSAPLPSNLAPKSGHSAHAASNPSTTPSLPQTPAREGEWFAEMKPEAPYTPHKAGGMDDYHCFLLDPGLTTDALVSGVNIVPGNPNLVHHVIVHQVPPDKVAKIEAEHREELESGWTCFGGNPVGGGLNLQRSTWLAGWAPGQGERLLADDLGMPLAAGAKVVVQMHYNLLKGPGADQTMVRLRLSPVDGSTRKILRTALLPAPVELPCREGVSERLCDRESSVLDLMARTGEGAAPAASLHLLCGEIDPGPIQSCTTKVREPMVVRAAAGHMHLLGRSITIDIDKGAATAQRILDIPVWDFDDQGAIPLPEPVTVKPGQQLTVTCEHDQSLRDLLPAFEGTTERYVTWGDGTTDEMCLGIVLWHEP